MATPATPFLLNLKPSIVRGAFDLLLIGGLPLHKTPAMTLLRGNVFMLQRPAADFVLTDQQGKRFHMADTKGRVVVLSFLYTHCFDFCPLAALKLKETMKLLRDDASKVVVVPVTTDPQRDTTEVLAAYSKAIGMYDSWQFVTGTRSDMRKVWKDYFIRGEEEAAEMSLAATSVKIDPQEENQAREESEKVAYGLSDGDKEWGADATPAEIAFDVRTLLAEVR